MARPSGRSARRSRGARLARPAQRGCIGRRPHGGARRDHPRDLGQVEGRACRQAGQGTQSVVRRYRCRNGCWPRRACLEALLAAAEGWRSFPGRTGRQVGSRSNGQPHRRRHARPLGGSAGGSRLQPHSCAGSAHREALTGERRAVGHGQASWPIATADCRPVRCRRRRQGSAQAAASDSPDHPGQEGSPQAADSAGREGTQGHCSRSR